MADNKVTLKYTWANILCWLQKETISLKFPMGIKIPGSIKFELASSLELHKCPTRQTIREKLGAREIATTYSSFTFHKNPSNP